MRYDVVSIVASRRGIPQLCELLSHLPPQFGMPIVCLAEADARLVAEVSACTPLQVKWAQQGEELRPGCVYLSPPGSSAILLEDRRVALSPVGPESSAHHPVDSFLISTGRVYGNRALAIVLGAFGSDGAEGAHSLKWRGGTVLVLDRATADFYGMADAIVKRGSYDHILTSVEVGEALRASFTGQDLLANAQIQFELGAVLDSALRIAGTDMGNIRVADRERRRLYVVAHRGLGKKYLERLGVVPADGDLACARALRYRQRVVVEDVLADSGYAAYADIVRAVGIVAIQATPIHAEAPGSVFSTFYRHPHVVGPGEAESLDRIASDARDVVARLR